MDASISIDHIQEAASVIDPVFLNSPQLACEPLSARLGVTTVLKVECLNPIRSFKGRGTDYLVYRLGEDPTPLVCASAGNFGQGMAHACRKAKRRLTVFAAHSANTLKVDRMRELGANVVLYGDDFDEAKDAAKRYADDRGELYIEDGRLGPIGEGAGTIASELMRLPNILDAIFVPLGNGALVNGVGTWFKRFAPETRVIAVCADGAPAMALSWKTSTPVSKPTTTIADGIAVRVPVAEAVELMRHTVDDVVLVSDDEMLTAMRWLLTDVGLVVEPSGAAGVAAIAKRREGLAGKRVATILTGGNLTPEQISSWYY